MYEIRWAWLEEIENRLWEEQHSKIDMWEIVPLQLDD